MLHYFYFADNQSYGPYSKEQILELNLPDDTQIWDDRIKEWKELIHVFEIGSVSNKPDIKPIISEMDWFMYINIGKTSMYISRKIQTYKMSFWFMSAFLFIQLGIIGVTYQSLSKYYNFFDFEKLVSFIGIIGFSLILRFGFFVSGLICLISFCEIIYYSWKITEPNHENISASKAIGYLFIPIYNIYWAYYIFANLPKVLLSKAQKWGMDSSAFISESLVLTTAILFMLSLIPFINIFIFIPFLILSYIYMLKIADYTHLLYRQIEINKMNSSF